MKRFLWVCMMTLLLFSCGRQQPEPDYRSPRAGQQERPLYFKMPDSRPIEGIYDTPAAEYIGMWKYKYNCGEYHSGKGRHDINGVVVFKDNGQFQMGFVTYQGDSLVYQVKRDGYWLLSDDESYIDLVVAHEINSNLEIIIVNQKVALKVFFKLSPKIPNKGQYMDEYQRMFDFQKKTDGVEIRSPRI